MKRTISGMMGAGSLAHNRRAFIAENVDSDRTHLNVKYYDENLRKVYHELFDEAVERYNAVQKRNDRKITDYYEKIRQGKQEKLFHEMIIQIGNKDDMSSDTVEGETAAKILDEYMKDFQQRNPTLRVFNCYLHMDEATPHLHIDFVPYISGWKGKGLDTKVSLKKVRSEEVKALEKENALLTVQNESLIGQMVESRADIKILEQTKADAEKAVEEAKDRADHAEKEAEKHEKRLENLKPIIDSMNAETADFKEKIEEQLPQAGTLELASSYREKKAKPLFIRMKNKIASLAVRVEQVTQKLTNARIEIKILKREKKSLQEENSILIEKNKELQEENAVLKSIAIMFDRVVRVMGEDTVFLAVRKDEEREKFENRKKEQPEKEQSVLKRLEIAKQTVAVREEDKIKSKPKKWNMER